MLQKIKRMNILVFPLLTLALLFSSCKSPPKKSHFEKEFSPPLAVKVDFEDDSLGQGRLQVRIINEGALGFYISGADIFSFQKEDGTEFFMHEETHFPSLGSMSMKLLLSGEEYLVSLNDKLDQRNSSTEKVHVKLCVNYANFHTNLCGRQFLKSHLIEVPKSLLNDFKKNGNL